MKRYVKYKGSHSSSTSDVVTWDRNKNRKRKQVRSQGFLVTHLIIYTSRSLERGRLRLSRLHRTLDLSVPKSFVWSTKTTVNVRWCGLVAAGISVRFLTISSCLKKVGRSGWRDLRGIRGRRESDVNRGELERLRTPVVRWGSGPVWGPWTRDTWKSFRSREGPGATEYTCLVHRGNLVSQTLYNLSLSSNLSWLSGVNKILPSLTGSVPCTELASKCWTSRVSTLTVGEEVGTVDTRIEGRRGRSIWEMPGDRLYLSDDTRDRRMTVVVITLGTGRRIYQWTSSSGGDGLRCNVTGEIERRPDPYYSRDDNN